MVNDILPVRKLVGNPLSTTSGSKVITVTHKNHGMHDSASNVTIDGAATTNGITGSDIDGTYVHSILAFSCLSESINEEKAVKMIFYRKFSEKKGVS